MLDTNTASYIIKGQPPEVRERLVTLPMDRIVISAATKGELFYGLARKGHPAALARLVREFLLRVTVLPWEEHVAEVYGDLCTSCTAAGATLGALDMMIAAHAVAAHTMLITHDRAFSYIPDGALTIDDWVSGARNTVRRQPTSG